MLSQDPTVQGREGSKKDRQTEKLGCVIALSPQPVPGELWNWDGPFVEFSWVRARSPAPKLPLVSMSYGMGAVLGRGMTLAKGLSLAEGKSQKVCQ